MKTFATHHIRPDDTPTVADLGATIVLRCSEGDLGGLLFDSLDDLRRWVDAVSDQAPVLWPKMAHQVERGDELGPDESPDGETYTVSSVLIGGNVVAIHASAGPGKWVRLERKPLQDVQVRVR